jgi:hypothetical protein
MIRLFFALLFLRLISTVSNSQNFGVWTKARWTWPIFLTILPMTGSRAKKAIAKGYLQQAPKRRKRDLWKADFLMARVWRTGANEATEIKFYQDIELAGKKVAAGTYSLLTIPGEKEWTIILNSDLDYWGAYSL